MEPRLVDERDTMWEAVTGDFRIFLIEGGRASAFDAAAVGVSVSAYDVDGVTLPEVELWARENAGPGTAISIALREVNYLGQPGLRWLVGEPI